MGTLRRFNLDRLIRNFNTSYLFETGTWKGDSIAYAEKSSFKHIYSSEIIEEIADKAKKRFAGHNKIDIITDNSIDALRNTIDKMTGNCLFWLDAHFPGAEEGISGYNETKEDEVKLPLEKEIEIIASRKKKYQDVILIDDLRIYEVGPFVSGNMPDHIARPKIKNENFIEDAFGSTHTIEKSYIDEGYILIFPNTKAPESALYHSWYKLYNNLRHKIY